MLNYNTPAQFFVKILWIKKLKRCVITQLQYGSFSQPLFLV